MSPVPPGSTGDLRSLHQGSLTGSPSMQQRGNRLIPRVPAHLSGSQFSCVNRISIFGIDYRNDSDYDDSSWVNVFGATLFLHLGDGYLRS